MTSYKSTILWQKTHKDRVRAYKLLWYYRNRKMINLMFSKPTGVEDDEADRWMERKGGEEE